MRFLPLLFAFAGSAVLACSNPQSSCMDEKRCGCSQMQHPLVETITYALGEMGLQDNSDIRAAIRMYKKDMRSMQPEIPLEAFRNGNFDPDVYAKNATPAKALQAQVDLFDTIYLILNDEQKKEFPKLIRMYQHHMRFITVPPMCMKGCDGDGTMKMMPQRGKMMPMSKTPMSR